MGIFEIQPYSHHPRLGLIHFNACGLEPIFEPICRNKWKSVAGDVNQTVVFIQNNVSWFWAISLEMIIEDDFENFLAKKV